MVGVAIEAMEGVHLTLNESYSARFLIRKGLKSSY